MKTLEHPVLADQNIHPAVVEGMRARGVDVETLEERDLVCRRLTSRSSRHADHADAWW
jgi:hypothetical protein